MVAALSDGDESESEEDGPIKAVPFDDAETQSNVSDSLFNFTTTCEGGYFL